MIGNYCDITYYNYFLLFASLQEIKQIKKRDSERENYLYFEMIWEILYYVFRVIYYKIN